MSVKHIPEGLHTATPYLLVRNGADAIDFYVRAFAASELLRMAGPDGSIGHAEIKIGDSVIMLAEEAPELGFKSPLTLGGAGAGVFLYVDDVDRVFGTAVGAGAREVRPVVDQFWGDRSGTLVDPFGHMWTIATRREDVSPEELRARTEEFFAQAERATDSSQFV